MTIHTDKFRISTHLKDIIGRELVTKKYVAMFELVKNSIDARATIVSIEFNFMEDRIFIVDNGKGMSRDDLINKWLFVAYSAKSDGSEDEGVHDYRENIGKNPGFAGRKGIGRFSCDTLGSELNLYSRSSSDKMIISHLHVDWSEFEKDKKAQFSDIDVQINDATNFPSLEQAELPNDSGTILEITGLRETWGNSEIMELRTYLAKLIDPFGISRKVEINTYVVDSTNLEKIIDGPIGNDVAKLLKNNTSRIQVHIKNNSIVTELFDKGFRIFKVSEDNSYNFTDNCEISASIYFLNRSAKLIFKKRMGVSSVNFGSIFLFLNGFRIFPIGEESDDAFGLDYRKYQGHSRKLGTRDVLGRVDVTDPDGKFREVSSRDAGLIDDANSRELYNVILNKVLIPLERYVVGVNWPDKSDAERNEFAGFQNDDAKLRILNIIGNIAKNPKVKFLNYDDNIVNITDKNRIKSENTLNDLLIIAERENNPTLIKRIKDTKARIKELEKIEKNAEKLTYRMEKQSIDYEKKINSLEREANFLASGQKLDAEKIQLLIHQIHIYSGHISSSTFLGLAKSRKFLNYLSMDEIQSENNFGKLIEELKNINEDVMEEFSYIRLENKRILTVLRIALFFNFNMKSNKITGNFIIFLKEYFSIFSSETHYGPITHFKSNNSEFYCKFSPFDISVIIDNLVDNSRKARAQNIWFEAKVHLKKKLLEIHVSDDGLGLDSKITDPSRIFNKHYSSSDSGTGLGLFHVKQILNELGGNIELKPSSNQTRANFVITIPGARQ